MSTPPDPSGDDTARTSDRGSTPDTPPGAPRWVKALAIIVGVVVLLALIMVLTGVGGEHGPGRHTGTGVTVGVTAEETATGGDV